MIKKLYFTLRVLITLLVVFIGIYVLNQNEYLSNFNEVDNFVGIMPVVLVLVFILGSSILLWMKHSKRLIFVSITIAFIVTLSVITFPNSLRGNWWLGLKTAEGTEAAIDLSVYAPFDVESKVAKLDEPSSLLLADDLPILDGATALYPVYAAFAQAVYDESVFIQDYVLCTNTSSAYQAIIDGERDIIFVAGASAQQIALAKEQGVDLCFTPIGKEAFVFIVGIENPIDDITYQQIRNIYSGKTAYWNTLGWKQGGKIIAFLRPEGSGSQTGLQNIMKEINIQVPQPLPDVSLVGTNSLMQQVSVKWKGVQPAIGYSYRFYATTMYSNPDAKLLKVNGVEPSIENIQNGTYPFVVEFYGVTSGVPKDNTKLFIEWILSTQGQSIIEKTGYVPLVISNKYIQVN